MQTFRAQPTWCCLALATIALAAPGCQRRLRGVETADQVLLRGGKSVLQQADGIEAVVTPVRVPWASKNSPIGFALELTNLTEGPVHLAVADIELHDSLDRIFEPMPPEHLLRSFGIGAEGEGTVQTVGHRPRHVRRHVRHHYRHYPRYVWYRGYPYYYRTSGWRYGGLRFDSGADPYARQRQTARFLSELLTDQTVEPQHVAFGHVVFAYRLDDDEQLTLVVSVARAPEEVASQPAEPGVEAEEATERVTRLVFLFEVD